eukprot:TRINITY_DN5831_c0_g1_i1.p1 TRINITY_DN5831_c0_g1~~TRINITY_DN5831_c0_g1_i1.p1  ORF type:complete len:149 (-),score=36.90 TRINITY_DN5831_c0_g1_i1:36-482(-)
MSDHKEDVASEPEMSGTFVKHSSDKRSKKQSKSAPLTATQLQEELRAIYRKDCTIRIPFLHLSYINPMALLYEEEKADFTDTLSEMCSEEESLTMENINSKTTISNLLATLDYHSKRQKLVPMNAQEVEQNARMVRELNSTIKTILRL